MASEHPLYRCTPVAVGSNRISIERGQPMLWAGSCFVNEMEPILLECQYDALVNPLGVAYHPGVLTTLLEQSAEELAAKTFEKDGVWLNRWLAASFVGSTAAALNGLIAAKTKQRDTQLRKADWLVLTWGTAYWYQHKNDGMVGKCHKLPANQFIRRRSVVDEIVGDTVDCISRLRRQNPRLKVVVTVSPVRHTKEGMEENAISKATLRLAAAQLVETLPDIFYFPAYELVIDELRDYRFYKSDLVHPTEEAVLHIWQQFEKQFFSPHSAETNRLLRQFCSQKRHRPQADFGREYEKWQADLAKKSQAIEGRLAAGW